MNEAYLYPYSAEYARQRGEESLWRASYLSNMDCKDAIRKAVWQHYDGAHLDGDCLAKVIQLAVGMAASDPDIRSRRVSVRPL